MAENTQSETNGGNKSTIAIVIAIIGIVAAGFFFFQYQSGKTANDTLQDQLTQAEKEAIKTQESIEKAKKEISDAVSEGRAIIGTVTSEVIKTGEELNKAITAQESEIDALNASVAGQELTIQCKQLLEVGPKNADTWYTVEYSENFQQNICKYTRDMQRDYDAAVKDGNENATTALKQAQAISEPYYDNFADQCSSIYDLETCAFK